MAFRPGQHFIEQAMYSTSRRVEKKTKKATRTNPDYRITLSKVPVFTTHTHTHTHTMAIFTPWYLRQKCQWTHTHSNILSQEHNTIAFRRIALDIDVEVERCARSVPPEGNKTYLKHKIIKKTHCSAYPPFDMKCSSTNGKEKISQNTKTTYMAMQLFIINLSLMGACTEGLLYTITATNIFSW